MFCIHCDEEILPHEVITDAGGKLHRECLLRSVVGCAAHQRRLCRCFGGSYRHSNCLGSLDSAVCENGLSRRENAIAAARYFLDIQDKAAKAKFN